jgi:hypothetical protein
MRLTPHPTTPLPAGWSLTARVDADPAKLQLEWTLQADLAAILLPAATPPARRDGLWRHTCFELFVADAAGEGYREFNFSPSSAWAAYAFTSYREGMSDLGMPDAPRIALAVAAGELVLTAELPRAAIGPAPDPVSVQRRFALAAVLERVDGGITCLALAHPPGRPDFHHRAGFVGELAP